MDLIPDFSLPASTGQTLSRSSFLGKVGLVVVFVPDPRGPDRYVVEEYSELLRDFGSLRIQVLLVARLTAREARELAAEIGAKVPILADAGGEMAAAFGAAGPGGAVRAVTVIAGEDGGIVRRLEPGPDPAAVLDAVREGSVVAPPDEAELQEPPD